MTDEVSLRAGYDRVAKALHWLMVLLIVIQFAIAWTMPGIHRGTRPETLINLHLSLGVTILLVALFRLFWRIGHPVPLDSKDVPPWTVGAAYLTHAMLYVLLVAIPLLGWANASSRGWAIKLWGLVPLPLLVPAGSHLGHAAGDIHTLMAYALLALIGLHLAATLYHQFWLRDRVLARMLA